VGGGKTEISIGLLLPILGRKGDKEAVLLAQLKKCLNVAGGRGPVWSFSEMGAPNCRWVWLL